MPTSPLRLLHVGTSAAVRGGGVVMVQYLRALAERGHEVAAAFPEPGPLAEQLEGRGIPVHYLGRVRSACPVAPLGRLLRVVKHSRPQVLHTHDEMVNLLGRVCRLACPRLSVVSSVHVVPSKYAGGPYRRESPTARTRRRLRYRLYRLADSSTCRLSSVVVAHSRAIAEDLHREGVAQERIAVLRHGLAEDWFEAGSPTRGFLRRRFPQPLQSGPLLGVVGAIEEDKGQLLLVEAAPAILASEPRAVIVFIGQLRDERYRQALISRAQALGVAARIWLTGHVEDMRAAYADVDLVVQTSYREGLPLAAMEAMAAGRPVLATEAGGTTELITHEKTGLLIPPGDAAALARSIIALLASPAKRARLGEAAQAYAGASFRLAPIIDALEGIYARTSDGFRD